MNRQKVREAATALLRYKQEGGELAHVGPLAALKILEEALSEDDSPLPPYEMVKGGDLSVGDEVLLRCRITAIRNEHLDTDHVLIRASDLPRPWMAGDQYLWTWGGRYGSGDGNPPDIMRVTR